MQQKGYVSSVDNDMAQVVVDRESACGHSCSTCGGGCGESQITLSLKNTLGAKEGDYVLIESKSSTILKSAFIAYIMPLILMLIGVSLGIKVFSSMGYENYETLSFFVGLAFLVVSYFILRFVDNKYFRGNDSLLEMVDIVKE